MLRSFQLHQVRMFRFGTLASSIATFTLCTFLFLIYLFGLFYPSWVSDFSVSFGAKMQLYRYITFSFVTDEFCTLVLSMLSIFIFTKLVLDAWGVCEMVAFFTFVNFSAIFLSMVSCFLIKINLTDNKTQYTVFNGLTAFISAVFAVSKQFDPERFFIGYRSIGLKSKHGFWLGLILFIILRTLKLIKSSSLLLYFYGFFCAWIYLRFLQRHSQSRFGDHRLSFTFSSLFPEPVDKFISVPSNMIHGLLIRAKLFPASLERSNEVTLTKYLTVKVPPVTSDLERHRQIALKALNERLSAKNQNLEINSDVSWPNLEENEVAYSKKTEELVPENKTDLKSSVNSSNNQDDFAQSTSVVTEASV